MSGESSAVKWGEAQEKVAKDAFDKFDKRDAGQIKVGDILLAMSRMGQGVKSEWLEKHEEAIDMEGTGYINFDDFCILVKMKMKEDDDEKELKELFRVLDKKKKGEVPVGDLRWILKELGDDFTEEEIDEMIADVDTDGSGWVDYDEFAALMMS